MFKSKKYKQACEKIDPEKIYSLEEAVEILPSTLQPSLIQQLNCTSG